MAVKKNLQVGENIMKNKLMKNKLIYILLSVLCMFSIGCNISKNIRNDVTTKDQAANEKSEKKLIEEPDKEYNEESNQEIDQESRNESEVTTRHKKKIIYLTFDDGPSYKVTNNVLDILKENKVKATFFLIGNQIGGREEIVQRIYNEGNKIGLHSYTHKYKKIYANEDEFINEMRDCRNEINRVIGISPKIIRFPGGSYKRLSKELLKRLHEENFKVYDWNAENSDGLKPKTSPDELYEKAISWAGKNERIILLMHCTDANQNTCKALPEIIEYYKSQGYEFRLITDETKELYFPIKI